MWTHEPGGDGQPTAPAERVLYFRGFFFFFYFCDPIKCDSRKSKDMVELFFNYFLLTSSHLFS